MQANDTVWVVVQWWPRNDFPPLIEVFGERMLAEYDVKRKRDQDPESRVILQEAAVRDS